MKTNLTYLKTLSGGNVTVLREMIDLFIEQIKEILEGMNKSLEKQDWLSLSQLAHKAKSSVAIMGMSELEEELRNLELLSSEKKEENTYNSRVEKFSKECKLAIEELNIFLNENK